MKIFFKKRNLNLILLFIPVYIFCEEIYPPLSSSYHLRIINRRFISHILFETIENKKYITIILTHGPNYWAYKSNSYRLFYECENSKKCLEEAIKIDEFLQTGYNIAFVIEGDYIKKIIFLEKPKQNKID